MIKLILLRQTNMYGPHQPLQVNWQWGREKKKKRRQAVLTSLAISLKRNREEVIRLLIYTSGSPLASANVSHTGHFALWINVSILARKRKVHENPSLCVLNLTFLMLTSCGIRTCGDMCLFLDYVLITRPPNSILPSACWKAYWWEYPPKHCCKHCCKHCSDK